MEQGTVEGYAQGGASSYEFISNRERQKKALPTVQKSDDVDGFG